MGLLDWLTGGDEAQVKRHAKRIANINAQAEEREMSAQWLAQNGSDAAIAGLLGRFGLTIESQMKDAREKQLVYDLLVELGPRVVPATRDWLSRATNLGMPLKLVAHFEGEASVVGLLLELLGRENDPFKTEKKRQILIKLTEFKDSRIVPAVTPLLKDFDEGVRYAAAEVLISQDDVGGAPALAAALANPEEESNRVRVRIAEGMVQRRWSLGEHTEAITARPPYGWKVVEGRLSQA